MCQKPLQQPIWDGKCAKKNLLDQKPWKSQTRSWDFLRLEADKCDISRYKMATTIPRCCLRYSIWSNQDRHMVAMVIIMVLSLKCHRNGGWASPWPEVKLQWHAAACRILQWAGTLQRLWLWNPSQAKAHAIPISKQFPPQKKYRHLHWMTHQRLRIKIKTTVWLLNY